MPDSAPGNRSHKALLEAARGLDDEARAAFLDRACGDDPALRRQIEAMLAEEDTALGSAPADAAISGRSPLSPGLQIGPYRLEARIGKGGMGEVFKAFDTRLRRRVALKAILADSPAWEEALHRFEREMRTLAALDHPNILRIYDAGEHAGTPYAVTELLTGEPLSQLLSQGPLPVPRALDFARQMLRGLLAAHDAGIVHRDLKPHNLFVSQDGTLKILDFGLAKFLPGANTGMSYTDLTILGEAVGTPQYMTPEQIRGEACDRRADLFAFGAIFYEMLTGERAFVGETFANVMYAILYSESPDLLERHPDVGGHVAGIVERCLEKDPLRRPSSAAELLAELDLGDTAPTRYLPPPSPTTRDRAARKRRLFTHGATAALAITLTAAILLWLRPPQAEPWRLEYLTDSSRDWAPTVSADGKWIAYVSDRDGRSRIWIRQLATGEERSLAAGGGEPDFSAQADLVLFSRQEADGTALYSVGPLGGEPRRILSRVGSAAWSPDGSHLGVVRELRGDVANHFRVAVAAADGSDEREVYEADAPIPYLRWSPDGRWIYAVVQGSAVGRGDELWRIDTTSGKASQINVADHPGRLSRPALSVAGNRLYVAVGASLTGYAPASRIVAVDLAHDRRSTELWVPATITTLDLSADNSLIFDANRVAQSLRALTLDADGPHWQHWLTRGRALDREPTSSPDGSELVFSSNRSGDPDLWGWSAKDGRLRRIAPHAGDDWDPFLSRNGRHLLWSSNRSGELEIWMAGADGAAPHQLTRASPPAENPSITADGRWVVYSSSHPEHGGLRRVGADGRDDQLIVKSDLGRGHPEVSPDGRFILVHDHFIDGLTTLRAVTFDGGHPTAFTVRIQAGTRAVDPNVTLGRAHWRPDGSAVAFVGLRPDGTITLLEQAFAADRDTSATRRDLLPSGADEVPESFVYAGDSTHLVISLVERSSTIMAARH